MKEKSDKVIATDRNNESNKRYMLLGLSSFVAIIALVMLSINFTFTYKLKGDTTNENTSISTSNIPINSLNENKNNVPEANKNTEIIHNTSKETNNSCSILVSLIQEYFNLKLKIAQSRDYSEEIERLKLYNIKSPEVNNLFDELAFLVDFNKNEDYFREKFKPVIKEIYLMQNENNNLIAKYFKKTFFIRPIENRAIANGGNDKEIALAEKFFSEGNLSRAFIHIRALSNLDQLADFRNFKIELENKLRINSNIEQLDKLFINHLNCNEVSK